jgi:glycosyltransferase involved in cell wall biosynthesis
VSDGVKSDLASLGIKEQNLIVVNNPIDLEYVQIQSKIPPTHPWIVNKTEPLLLGIGRLTEAKGFDILLRAFAVTQKSLPTKLIILGDGPLRSHLLNLSAQLGIEEKVDFPGFVDNPYVYIKNSDVLVLSSRWEGFVNVILESLALGTQVVATDCWSSPREILLDGILGCLVPINDPKSLAESIINTLNNPKNPDTLKNRALDFSPDRILDRYLDILSL